MRSNKGGALEVEPALSRTQFREVFMSGLNNLRASVRLSIAIFSLALLSGAAFAQDTANMQILRDKVKADKKLLVAANMELTEAEGTKFWPIYDAYQKDLEAVNHRLGAAITSYAEAYNNKTLTDDQAKKLTADVLMIEEDEVKMRKTYGAKLAAVLPGKKVARYLQIESKIKAALWYDLAGSIPLVQ